MKGGKNMNNENNCYEGSILHNALEEMRNRKNCCCPRYIVIPTGPTGGIPGPTGATHTTTSESNM